VKEDLSVWRCDACGLGVIWEGKGK